MLKKEEKMAASESRSTRKRIIRFLNLGLSERRPISGKDIHKAANDTGSQAKSFIQSIFRDISKTSATKQIILGASSGWITGFVSMKVGKTLALALGGGIILLQVANEKGYIRINWNKVNKKLDKVVDKVEEQITGETSSWTDKVMNFARNNTPFSSGLIGGFLIGLASH
ncbi:FUN14 domain-containing protein 2-like isoform X5 [Diorhabda carinulata]|uniref:FUN14 domain-containing protein 2-like isoform X5 n=1 Tax=Diorhabda carinulata TaxID=1163345 RepID=UPI0025A076AF|nr:FUN14 domain-containing protein 2-like isoform X5 [Diorhabda carinulata]